MRSTKLTRFVLSKWSPLVVITIAAAVLMGTSLFGQSGAPELKITKIGLGLGTVTSRDTRINCGTDCQENYTTPDTVILDARPGPDSAVDSTFVGWGGGDCTGTGPCSVTMSAAHSVRAEFQPVAAITEMTEGELTPEGIAAYLSLPANAHVNSPARFIRALPRDYRQNWILMTRSESLQTGTAASPRILLPGENAQNVFTIGMTEHSSYPGAHHNAIEYMQWDPAQKNFRFHEIVLAPIGAMGDTLPDGTRRFRARERSVSRDDEKCSKCHSTRNVFNVVRVDRPILTATPTPGPYPATDGVPAGSVGHKNKPNWDAYDSWGGMLPFNRDRIYQGSLEATAFKRLFNLWNWGNNDGVRQVIEQLELQPPHVAGSNHNITRNLDSTDDDQHIRFGFDSLAPIATTPNDVGYSFDRATVAPTPVPQGGRYVTLRHSRAASYPSPNTFNDDYRRFVPDEGRGVQLFDLLGGFDGQLNQLRVADELINHKYVTGGSRTVDVRPLVLAIFKSDCLTVDPTTNTVIANPMESTETLNPSLAAFFNARNEGMNITQVRNDTMTRWGMGPPEIPATRSTNFPRRKADIQRINLDRSDDPYLFPTSPAAGLILEHGGATSGDTSVNRLRLEVFRRPGPPSPPGESQGFRDSTKMEGDYVDREQYDFNTTRVAMFRYFLEPLGVSVDKWSMNVRGRSRTYNFADIFSFYKNTIEVELSRTLSATSPTRITDLTDTTSCTQLVRAVNTTLSSLPDPDEVPTYTDIQRIFNKSCIECHGGLGYPPYGPRGLDLSEDERPPSTVARMMSPRLFRSYEAALSYVGPDATNRGFLYDIIRRPNEDCRPPMAVGLMPCGGPALSKVDIETIRRWIDPPGEPSNTAGDPHIRTVDGVNYDFQSAGEFVLLRDEYLEIQTRQTALDTQGPLPANQHTGLSSCVSVNGAAAVRMGQHRITYQPNLSGEPDPSGLQLRIDGKLTPIPDQEILLPLGGRIVRTPAPGGIKIEGAGGTAVIITPGFLDHYQIWHMNIDALRPRATKGVMGTIAPGSWLPALPDGSSVGPRTDDPHQWYVDLYDRFENAWRVNDGTTLFDYATGTSTATFTIDSWPVENPQGCTLPRRVPSGPMARPPQPALPLAVAQQHCAAIVANDRRDNCVQDVMITGEPSFAKVYLMTEQIERNARPTAPVLTFPEDDKLNLDKDVTFTWNNATDADGDGVRYRHCVWITGDKVSFKDCDASSIQTGSVGQRRGILYALLVLLLICLLLAILIFLFVRQRRVLLALAGIILVVAVILAFYIGRTRTSSALASKTVSTLKPGQTYLWKVIVDDGKGGTNESKTQRFTTQ